MQQNWEKYIERLVRDYSHFLLLVRCHPSEYSEQSDLFQLPVYRAALVCLNIVPWISQLILHSQCYSRNAFVTQYPRKCDDNSNYIRSCFSG